MPSQDKLLTFEEIFRVTHLLVNLGVQKVRITGGEPLVRRDIGVLVKLISGIDNLSDIAMTTNGYLLPKLALSLKEAGLTRLTVSLDTLNKDSITNIVHLKRSYHFICKTIITGFFSQLSVQLFYFNNSHIFLSNSNSKPLS